MRMRHDEPCDTITVTVTFLRMDGKPSTPAPEIPVPTRTERVLAPTVGFYRYLYNTVGADYVWWLRRVLPDAELARLLEDPSLEIHVLYKDGEPAGFFELDARYGTSVNLSYFGLMPHMIGTGAGPGFLRQAIEAAWRIGPPRTVTVNTCTADHPRALPNYIRAGFKPLRAVQELWEVPLYLGLHIPEHLRV
jgi:GNAT superfamily N-acetyltransferase